MPTPISYTPQFIPTNIGAISNILDKRQAEYDAGYAAPLMFEDKYSQIPVTPENIAGKQAILENFQGKIKKIVDRYGGDYGAAAKDITREIAKERQNPFYQLAPQHMQASSRQQALRDKYGAFALPVSEVPSQFVTPEGKVLQDINLNPEILNQQDLEKALLTEYGKRGSKIRQSGLYKTKKTPAGFYQQSTTRGITENEYQGVVDEMTQRLYEMHPSLEGDPRALGIAENMAAQLIGGQTIDYERDPSYKREDSSMTDFYKNYISRPGAGKVTGESIKETSEDVNYFKKAIEGLEHDKKRFEKIDEEVKNIPILKRSFNQSGEWNNAEANYKASKDRYERRLKPFKGEMFDDLIRNYGLSDIEAVNVVAGEKSSKPITHIDYVRPSAERSKDAILNDLSINLNDIDLPKVKLYDSNGNIKTKKREKFEEKVESDLLEGNIKNVEIDLKNNEILLHSKSGESYGIPAYSLGNEGVAKALSGYSRIMNTVYGKKTATSGPIRIGGIIIDSEKKFNPELGTYEEAIYVINEENRTKTKILPEELNDFFFTELFSTYGTEPQYKPTNLNE